MRHKAIFYCCFCLVYVSLAGFSAETEPAAKDTRSFRSVVCPSSDENTRNSEADLIELNDGTLFLAWSRFSGREDHDRADIAAKTSSDGGKTWSEEYVLQENTGLQNVMSVSLLRLRSGKILFFYLQKNADDDLQLYVKDSIDETKTWSDSRRVTQGGGYHIMNNARAIQLDDGRILAPIAYCRDISKQYHEQVSYCYISDDGGVTWRKGSSEVALPDAAAMEPGLVQCSDGSVLMVIRTALDRIYQSRSHDLGVSWSTPEPLDLVSPAAPATTARIPETGDLLIVWNNNPLGNAADWQDRTPLTLAISHDNGVTWTGIQNLESDPDSGYAYTSITFYRDRLLLTYYHWKKGKQNFEGTDLIFHSIPLSSVY